MDRTRRRRFGQNFLDDSTAQMIAGDLPLLVGEAILEIGPGHGAMTTHLLTYGNPLTAVEIDPECVELLQKKFAHVPNFSIVNEDILKFDMDRWILEHGKPWLTGNLPYNISTAIIANLMPLLHKTCGFMGMVQWEVAKRLCAVPHTSDYGSLSVWVSAHAESRILRKIGPEHFTPKPNVDSATILLTPLDKPLEAAPEFFEFVQTCFSQKRKRITNCLVGAFEKSVVFAALESLDFSENTRAEELSPEQFLNLYNALNKLKATP